MVDSRKRRTTGNRSTDLGEYLQALRDEKGWSESRLAREAKVSYTTYSKLESGTYVPKRPDMLIRLADALDVHPDQLLLRALLTPYLRPPVDDGRQERKFTVTDKEYRELDNYLQIVRFTNRIV